MNETTRGRSMRCRCSNDWWWIHDGYGIPLAIVCDACVDAVCDSYRPDIFEQYESDEPIEPEEY